MDNADFEEKLDTYAEKADIPLEREIFEKDTSSADVTSDLLDASKERVVKTILFRDADTDDLYAVIVRATEMIDRQVIKQRYNIADLRMVDPENIVERIGYPVGGVPPFGFNATFILDADLDEDEQVWAGGGSPRSLIHFRIVDIIDEIQPDRFDVTK